MNKSATKRKTPRCDAAEAELERWIAAEEDGTEPPSILDLARTLETELQQKQKIIENHCKDWAEDDTAIKELCKRCGVADVHPVGDDFKSCVECVEELAHKFIQLRLAADGMRDETLESKSGFANRFHGNTPVVPMSVVRRYVAKRTEAERGLVDLLEWIKAKDEAACAELTAMGIELDPFSFEVQKRITATLARYRAAGEGPPKDTGTSRE